MFLNYVCKGKERRFYVPYDFVEKFIQLMEEVVDKELAESENKIKHILNY